MMAATHPKIMMTKKVMSKHDGRHSSQNHDDQKK
jgi:hypothetical protein